MSQTKPPKGLLKKTQTNKNLKNKRKQIFIYKKSYVAYEY